MVTLERAVSEDRRDSVVLTGICFAIMAFTVKFGGLEGRYNLLLLVLSFSATGFFGLAFMMYSRFPATGDFKALEWGRRVFVLGKASFAGTLLALGFYFLPKSWIFPIALVLPFVYLILEYYYKEKYESYLERET